MRTPTVVQQEAVECGAAALGIVLAYHGRYVPLEELRVACGVSRDGAKAANVLKAARGYGLTATGMRTELSGLRDSPLPAIVFWNFNHFLVVEGAGSRGVWVNDPANGPRRVSWEEFDRSFTGVVLELAPGPEFEAGGSRPRLVRALASRLSRVAATAPLALCVVAGLALAIPGLIVPAFLKIFVDLVLGQGDRSLVVPLALGLVAAAIAQAGLTWLQQLTLIRLSTKLSLSMSTRFVRHMLRLPVGFFLQRFAGHLVARVALNDQVASLLSSQLATTVLSIVSALVYAVAMLVIDPVLGAVTIALGAANFLALRAVSRRRRDVNVVLVSESGKLSAISFAGIQAIETIKASGAEDDFFARWSGQQAKVVNGRQDLGAATAALSAVPTLLAALSAATIISLGGLRVLDGDLSLGSLLAIQALAVSFTVPIQSLVTLGGTLQEAEGNLASLDDVLRYPPDEASGGAVYRGRPDPAEWPARVRGRELRLQPARPPTDRPPVAGHRARPAGGDRRADGQREVDDRASGHGHLSTVERPRPARRRPSRRARARPGGAVGVTRGPGDPPVRGDRPREPHDVGSDDRRTVGRSAPPGTRPSTKTSVAAAGPMSGSSRRMAATGAAGSASGSRSPARSPPSPHSWSSTRRRARSIRSSSGRSTRPCVHAAAPV